MNEILEYKYDVAFSFVQQDEELALQLYKILKDRVNCFIYVEQQKILAGNDGETVFNRVFGQQTRIVVVIYRKSWGTTKWTKIEETAIRNRGFDNGYDFVMLIPVEKEIIPPVWLPKNKIWIGIDRWGIESAASVIEARVQEFDGIVRVESVTDKIAITERKKLEQQKREQILISPDGLEFGMREMENLVIIIQKSVADIKNKIPNWNIETKLNNKQGIDVIGYGYYFTIQLENPYLNTIDGSILHVALLRSYPDRDQIIERIKLRFDINEFDQKGWSTEKTRQDFITSRKLADTWIEKYVDHVL